MVVGSKYDKSELMSSNQLNPKLASGNSEESPEFQVACAIQQSLVSVSVRNRDKSVNRRILLVWQPRLLLLHVRMMFMSTLKEMTLLRLFWLPLLYFRATFTKLTSLLEL